MECDPEYFGIPRPRQNGVKIIIAMKKLNSSIETELNNILLN